MIPSACRLCSSRCAVLLAWLGASLPWLLGSPEPKGIAATTRPALEEAVEEPTDLEQALQAMNDGLPEIAATKATRLLQSLTDTQRQTAALIAVEAWTRARRGDEALKIIEQYPVPNAEFWRAQALALSGQTAKARQGLETRLREGRATHQERLLLAQILVDQSQPQAARECLAELLAQPDSEFSAAARELHQEALLLEGQVNAISSEIGPETSPRARYIKARAMVERGQQDQALAPLRELVASTLGGPGVQQAALLLLAELEMRRGEITEALARCCGLLDKGPASSLWPQALRLMQRALRTQDSLLQPPSAWLQWLQPASMEDGQAPQPERDLRRHYGLLLMGAWLAGQQRHLEAIGLLETLLLLAPDPALRAEGTALAAQWHDHQEHSARSQELLKQWRSLSGEGGQLQEALPAELEFQLAAVALRQRDFLAAAQAFVHSAKTLKPAAAQLAALHNGGIAALQAGRRELYATQLVQLRKQGGPAAQNALEIERALWLASQPASADEAIRALEALLKNPQDPAGESLLRITLAELLLASEPPRIEEAQRLLASLEQRQGTLDSALTERLQLARLRRLEAMGELRELCLQGEAMLSANPNPELAALIGMKVAQTHHQLEDYAAARRAFESVARNHPNSPHADTALFFAGQCAMAMLNEEGRSAALALWQQLADQGGPLALQARQQQIGALRQFSQEPAALKVVESLLADAATPRQTRWTLSCEKAELQMLLAQKQGLPIAEAIGTLTELLSEKTLERQWRARAGFTLAMAHRQAGDLPAAIEACHEVIASNDFIRNVTPTDFLWYYRAGFLGIDLLEQSKQWEAAARLAEKLAQSNGNRAPEARERATKIRLEHFLWDRK